MNISRFLASPGYGRRAIAPLFRMATKPASSFPPTAQHGMREALTAAKNIERTILGQPLKPFRYRTMGMLASIGHHTGVASFFGFKFSGFIAWWMWRSVYLAKLPRLVKKLRVMIAWTLDLLFGRDIEQMITLRDVEELSERWTRIRADERSALAMDTTIVTALAGIVGSLCGGTASFATAWLTQKTRAKRDGSSCRTPQTRSALRRIHQRMLEARALDSFEQNLERSERLLSIYALLNRIRICASDAVLARRNALVTFIMEQYFSPNVSLEELHQLVRDGARSIHSAHSRSLPARS